MSAVPKKEKKQKVKKEGAGGGKALNNVPQKKIAKAKKEKAVSNKNSKKSDSQAKQKPQLTRLVLYVSKADYPVVASKLGQPKKTAAKKPKKE